MFRAFWTALKLEVKGRWQNATVYDRAMLILIAALGLTLTGLLVL